MEWGKGVPRTTSELKTRVGRWFDLLNKLGEVLLWNVEIDEGFEWKKGMIMDGWSWDEVVDHEISMHCWNSCTTLTIDIYSQIM